MAKTNGCLVAGVCLKYFFGDAPCAHACDRAWVDELKESWFEVNLGLLRVRVPAYLLKRWKEKLSSIYFEEEKKEDA